MISPDKVLKSMRLTEKTSKLSSSYRQYTFEVFPSATKHTVSEAIEQVFKVSVTRVNIQNIKGKPKRSRTSGLVQKSGSKRAIVALTQGEKIELV